jgi:hypothetical protein
MAYSELESESQNGNSVLRLIPQPPWEAKLPVRAGRMNQMGQLDY